MENDQEEVFDYVDNAVIPVEETPKPKRIRKKSEVVTV